MAKRGGGATSTRDSAQEAASRAIAAHESSLKALKRELEAAGHQPSATRRHLYLMIAKHHEGIPRHTGRSREQG